MIYEWYINPYPSNSDRRLFWMDQQLKNDGDFCGGSFLRRFGAANFVFGQRGIIALTIHGPICGTPTYRRCTTVGGRIECESQLPLSDQLVLERMHARLVAATRSGRKSDTSAVLVEL